MKRLAKVAMVAVVIALALGAMGVAYTSWTDSVTVTSTASTGSFAINMTRDPNSPSSANSGAWWAAAWQNSDGSFTTNQPIPAGTEYMGSNCNITFDAKKVTLQGVNWAPGLVCRADVRITNDGSMPIMLESFIPAEGQKTNAPMDWQCYDEGTAQNMPILLKPGEFRQCSGFLQSVPVGADGVAVTHVETTFTAVAHQWNAPKP